MKKSIYTVPVQAVAEAKIDYQYLTVSGAEIPILVKTPQALYFIDGRERLDEAMKQGMAKVECLIIEIEDESETEILLAKKAVRERTDGGEAFYPEKLLNTLHILQSIRGEMAIKFPRGGARRGEAFKEAAEKNPARLISQACHLTVGTVRKQIAHAEYLNINCLTSLTMEYENGGDGVRPNKAFFEKIQNQKALMVTKLQVERKTLEEITGIISAWLLKVWESHKNQAHNKPPVVEEVHEDQQADSEEQVTTPVDDCDNAVPDADAGDEPEDDSPVVTPAEPLRDIRAKKEHVAVKGHLVSDIVLKEDISHDDLREIEDFICKLSELYMELKKQSPAAYSEAA